MEDTYKKSKGNAGLDGVQFQVGLATVFLLNALRTLRGWRISTENETAGKFDDLVLDLSDGTSILLQAKHKDTKRITMQQLFSYNSKNADFSLPKYFFSYEEIKARFQVKNLIICTNTDVNMDKLKDISTLRCIGPENILHYEGGGCCFIKFHEGVLPLLKANAELYYDKNLRGKGIDKRVTSEQNLKDFLSKLQFFTSYPSDHNLNKVINELLFRLKDLKLLREISAQEIYKKVEEWFKQCRSEYLTEARAHAMFSEIRSDKYCNMLKNCNVLFQNNSFSFTDAKRIFHTTTNVNYLLLLLKVHGTLHNQEKTTLYVDPEDDEEVQRLSIEAFKLPKYIHLVFVWDKIADTDINAIIQTLREALDKYKYKKLVLLVQGEVKQVETIGLEACTIDGSFSFGDLAGVSRDRLLKVKNITFQGQDVSLRELIDASAYDDYGKALDPGTLKKLITGEKVKVGSRPLGLDEDTGKYYIRRTFDREVDKEWDRENAVMKRQEVFSEENIFDVNEKVILISDSAGTGKSIVLSKLALTIKERDRHKWVIRVELNDYTKFFMRSLKKNKRTVNITELLNCKGSTQFTNELEKFVFSMERRVVLLLDGFDEISPDYTDLVLNLLGQCKDASNFAKIIVTTRPNMTSELQAKLKVNPFILQPFTRQNQVDFLTSFWAHNLEVVSTNRAKCRKYSIALLDRMSSWINGDHHFAAIPLQIRMLAEIFQDSVGFSNPNKWKGCKEFLDGSESEPTLPGKIEISNLYDAFVKKKFEILIDKTSGSMAANDLFNSHLCEYLKNHQGLALEVILGNANILDIRISDLFPSYRYNSSMETNMLRIGIVQRSNESLEFIHRTFGEYFVAKSILDKSNWHRLSFNEDLDFQRFMVEEIFCNREFTLIRAFLDNFLENTVDKLPSNVFEIYQRRASSGIHERSCLIHLLAGEGYVAILKLILKSIDFKIMTQTETDLSGIDFDSIRHKHVSLFNNILTFLKTFVELCGINVRNELGETPLHYAAAAGRLEMVRFLIDQGAIVHGKDKEGVTALHVAAQKGHLDTVQYLVKQRFNVNVTDNDGFTALTSAVNGGHYEVVQFLVESGISVNSRSKGGSTALHLAAWKGNFNIVEYVVKHGADINAADNGGFTSLHSAAQESHLNVVKYLVDAGIDANATGHNGTTALHLAAWKGHKGIVEYLHKGGADTNIANIYCCTPLHAAAVNGHLEVVKILLKGGADINNGGNDGITALHLAAQEGLLDIVVFLVESGVDVNAADTEGYSALHSAARWGHLKVVRFLLQHGVRLSGGRNKDFTPLHSAVFGGHLDVVKVFVEGEVEDKSMLVLAARMGHLSIVKFLLKCNVDINVVDNRGFTALHSSASGGHLKVVKYLVENNIDTKARSYNGYTAMDLAAQDGQEEVVKFLLEQEVCDNTNNNYTALHLAARQGYTGAVASLLKQNVNVNAVDDYGFTSLHFAAQGGHSDIIQLLLESSADIDTVTITGSTPLHLACQDGYLDVVKMFVKHGANADSRDHNDFKPLHSAVFGCHLDIVKFLMQQEFYANSCETDKYHRALCLASRKGYIDIVKFLVESNVYVDCFDGRRSTPLHAAAAGGHMDVVMFLIENDADMYAENNDGYNAKCLAAEMGHLDIVGFLLEREIYIDPKNNEIALRLAAKNGHVVVVKLLLKYTVDANVTNSAGFTALHSAAHRKDKDGVPALHLAAQKGHLDTVKYLMKKKIDVNATDKDGFTALTSAVDGDHYDVVRFLVKSGISINSRSKGGSTALHLAAWRGNLDIAGHLVKHGVDINAADNGGFTALHSAALQDHLNVVKYLVDAGIDVNIKGNNDTTALHLVAWKGHKGIVEYLVEGCADVNIANIYSCTPLHAAAVNGHLEVVRVLVKAGADINNGGNDGITALHLAAQEGLLDIVVFLVDSGVDVNAADTEGYSALHSAARWGHLKIVRFLLQHGVRLSGGRNKDFTPLHSAVFGGHLDVVKVFVEGEVEDESILVLAARMGHLSIVKFLLKCNVDINVVDNRGFTALHSSASGGHLKVVKYLVENNIDTKARNYNGSTAMYLAAQNGQAEVVKFLLELEVYDSTNNSHTALHLAARIGYTAVVASLLKHNVNVNAVDHDGFTSLHVAAQRGHRDIIQLLLESGAGIDAVAITGFTPLHLACQEGHLEVVKMLVKHGGNTDSGNNNDFTPLHSAVFGCHLDIVKFLMQQELYANACEANKYHSALCLASRKGHIDIVKFLVESNVKLNGFDSSGSTPLHAAAAEGHMDVVMFLVENDADMYADNNDGYNAKCLAAAMGHLDIVGFLLEREIYVDPKNNEIALRLAARNGYVGVVKLLLNYAVDVNGTNNPDFTAQRGHSEVVTQFLERNVNDISGFAPIHLAASEGHLDTVKLLMRHGANVDVPCSGGLTALHLATNKGHLDVVKYLLESHIYVSIRDEKYEYSKVLLIAARKGHTDIARYLITCRMNVNLADSMGFTPLHCSASSGYLDIVKILIASGADVNVKTKNGFTALHLAVQGGHLDIVGYLLERGVDVNSRNYYGFTALHSAATRGNLNCVRLLLKEGAVIGSSDNGTTSLHLAAQKGHLDVVRFLVGSGCDVNLKNDDGRTAMSFASNNCHWATCDFLVQHANGTDGDRSRVKRI